MELDLRIIISINMLYIWHKGPNSRLGPKLKIVLLQPWLPSWAPSFQNRKSFSTILRVYHNVKSMVLKSGYKACKRVKINILTVFGGMPEKQLTYVEEVGSVIKIVKFNSWRFHYTMTLFGNTTINDIFQLKFYV